MFVLGLFPLLTAASSIELQDAWRSLASLDTKSAQRQFMPHATLGDPAARFGEALTLLQSQPRTARRLTEVLRLLAALERDTDGTSWARWARYYQARAAMLYPREPEFARAAELLLPLFGNGEEDEVADKARVKYTICVLGPLNDYAAVENMLASLAPIEEGLSRPAERRNYHLTVLQFLLVHEAPVALSLRHALAADEIGFGQSLTRHNSWITIGNLAFAAGDFRLAREYFERFLADNPRDNRQGLVLIRLEQIAELEGRL